MSRAGSAALATAGGLELLYGAGCTSTTTSSLPPAANRWSELARRLSGPLVRPGDPGFQALALPNNLRYAGKTPAGIALCESASDVSASIAWAREYGVPLVARSGGHSYGGYSTTTGLMIDVSRMRTSHFDASTGIVTLGGGSRNEDVYRDLRPYNVAITHGRCFRVGVAGLVLGGGVGFNMRSNGTTTDQLLQSQIVTADGRITTIDATHEPDLFWACRGGGGGNFGINTSFAFQTFPVGNLTAYNLAWTDKPEEVFSALATALESAPSTLGAKVSVFPPTAAERASGRGLSVHLLGQLDGTRAQLEEILQPVDAIAPHTGDVREDSYWNAQDFLSEQGLPAFYHESSRFFNVPVDARATGIIFDRLRRWPGTTKSAQYKMFATGGVMNRVAPAATAFVHRNSLWLSAVDVYWDAQDSPADVQRNLAWQREFYDAYVPLTHGGAYQNFIDPSLADWKTAYYGENLKRLEAVKAAVDPHHVFTFPEAIP